MSAAFVVIYPATKVCRRYVRAKRVVVMTHDFQIETDVTAEKIELMRTVPDEVGVPIEETPKEAA